MLSQLHILKSNLQTSEAVQQIAHVLNVHPAIIKWNVDTEDIDKVLRVETLPDFRESDIVALLYPYKVVVEDLAG